MNIHLAYIIRLEEAIKSGAEDPHIMYTSVVKVLISHAPILLPSRLYTQDILSDRELVWNKLLALIREHDCWWYISPGAQKLLMVNRPS